MGKVALSIADPIVDAPGAPWKTRRQVSGAPVCVIA
jgi:hypothetical protein